MRELRGVGIPRAQSPHGKEATVMAGCGVNRPALLPTSKAPRLGGTCPRAPLSQAVPSGSGKNGPRRVLAPRSSWGHDTLFLQV
jgi:hypothetical protein